MAVHCVHVDLSLSKDVAALSDTIKASWNWWFLIAQGYVSWYSFL